MNEIRFLALGDSYTIGEGVALEEGWPAQLQHLLQEAGCACATPEIIATTGWTTTDLIQKLQQTTLPPNFDLVSLLIGVNNQYQGLEIDRYEREFVSLIDQAIGAAGGRSERVLVLSIPDWSVTPFGFERSSEVNLAQVAKEIDAYNVINCREAYRRGCAYVDVTGSTREHKADPHAWTADGLHPAPLLYTQWARKSEPVVLARLEKD